MDHQIGIYQYVFVGNAFMRSALVANRQGVLNQKNVVFCVGNGFIRSETSVNIHGPLDGNGFLCLTFFHSTYPNKNVTQAERMNAFPTQKSSFYDSSNPGGE